MKKRVIFFTPQDAHYGFSLAGFEQHICTGEEMEEILEQAVKKSEYGLFVIDERLVSEHLDDRLRELERGLDLVFVIMPPPLQMEGKREDYALRLLRKAIGYHMQLNI